VSFHIVEPAPHARGFLRDDGGLTGTTSAASLGRGRGHVLLDGEAVRECMVCAYRRWTERSRTIEASRDGRQLSNLRQRTATSRGGGGGGGDCNAVLHARIHVARPRVTRQSESDRPADREGMSGTSAAARVIRESWTDRARRSRLRRTPRDMIMAGVILCSWEVCGRGGRPNARPRGTRTESFFWFLFLPRSLHPVKRQVSAAGRAEVSAADTAAGKQRRPVAVAVGSASSHAQKAKDVVRERHLVSELEGQEPEAGECPSWATVLSR